MSITSLFLWTPSPRRSPIPRSHRGNKKVVSQKMRDFGRFLPHFELVHKKSVIGRTVTADERDIWASEARGWSQIVIFAKATILGQWHSR
jgi:hypothetical protein